MGMSGGGGGLQSEINVTPMVDIMLVLLIIFMVITPLKPTRFKALVPSEPPPSNVEIKPNPLTLVVSIDKDLKLKLNQDDIGSVNDTSALSKRLSDIFNERRSTHAYE